MAATTLQTHAQARVQLARAQRLRLSRAEIRAEIARGERDPLAVLSAVPACMATMRTADFLEVCPMIGRDKVTRLNLRAAAAGVNLLRPLGALTDRQRAWLVERLPALQATKQDDHPTTEGPHHG